MIKLNDLIRAKKVIESLSREKVAIKTSYKFMKFINTVQADEDFYQNKFREIIEEFAEKDGDGKYIASEGGVKIQEDKREECFKAVADLEGTEVDKPNIIFTLDEIGELKLSTEDLAPLFLFIEE